MAYRSILLAVVLLMACSIDGTHALPRMPALAELRLAIPGLGFDTVTDALEWIPFFSTLRKAVRAARLHDLLDDRDLEATFVAPNDEAFRRLLKDLDMTEQELLDDDRLLRKVLKYHIVPGKALAASDIEDGQVSRTLLKGQDLTFRAEKYVFWSKITVEGCHRNSKPAMVIIPNIKAAKSVIHVIDEVVLPDLAAFDINSQE